MNYRDLRGRIDAEPFTPFRIVMTDGRARPRPSRAPEVVARSRLQSVHT